jgi:hypothetical protein
MVVVYLPIRRKSRMRYEAKERIAPFELRFFRAYPSTQYLETVSSMFRNDPESFSDNMQRLRFCFIGVPLWSMKTLQTTLM